MIENIILTLGMVYFFGGLFDKFNLLKKFNDYAQSKSKLLYRLSNCRFCIMFWVSVFSFVLVSGFKLLGIGFILFPFVVLGYFLFLDYDN